MKTRLDITARAFWTAESGCWFGPDRRWRLPFETECKVWDVLSIREDDADQMAKWSDPARE